VQLEFPGVQGDATHRKVFTVPSRVKFCVFAAAVPEGGIAAFQEYLGLYGKKSYPVCKILVQDISRFWRIYIAARLWRRGRVSPPCGRAMCRADFMPQ